MLPLHRHFSPPLKTSLQTYPRHRQSAQNTTGIQSQTNKAELRFAQSKDVFEQVLENAFKTVEVKDGFWNKLAATGSLAKPAILAYLTARLEGLDTESQSPSTSIGHYLFENPTSYSNATKALEEIPNTDFRRRGSLYVTLSSLGDFAGDLHQVADSTDAFNELHIQWLAPMTYVLGNLSEGNAVLDIALNSAKEAFGKLPDKTWQEILHSHSQSVPLKKQSQVWETFEISMSYRGHLLTSLFEKAPDEASQASIIKELRAIHLALSPTEQQNMLRWLDSKGYGPDYMRKPSRRRDEEIPLPPIPLVSPTDKENDIGASFDLKQAITRYIHSNFKDSVSHQVFTFFCPEKAGQKELQEIIHSLGERNNRPVIHLSGENNPNFLKTLEETRLLYSGKPVTIVLALPPNHPQSNIVCSKLNTIYNRPEETISHQKISSAEHTIFLIAQTTKEQLRRDALKATRNVEGITSLLSRTKYCTLQQDTPAQSNEQPKNTDSTK